MRGSLYYDTLHDIQQTIIKNPDTSLEDLTEHHRAIVNKVLEMVSRYWEPGIMRVSKFDGFCIFLRIHMGHDRGIGNSRPFLIPCEDVDAVVKLRYCELNGALSSRTPIPQNLLVLMNRDLGRLPFLEEMIALGE